MSVKNNIPNFVTSMNLACGLIGVVFAFKGRLDISFYFMVGGAVCDFLDGLVARLLKAVSPMGGQLDSLADLVTFGVLPSIMLYRLMIECMFHESWLCWIPLIIALASAWRLAKFNVDERQKSSFLGLPTPACGLLVAALCYHICYEPASFLATWAAAPVFVPVLSVVLAVLLVSEIPMFSLKMHKEDDRILKNKRLYMLLLVLAAIVVCVIFGYHWSFVVMTALCCYILKNIIYAIAKI